MIGVNGRGSIGRIRIVLGMFVVFGVVFGFFIGYYEHSLPEYSALGGILMTMVVAGVIAYRYSKRLERAGIADERSKQISYKATSIAWSGLVVALAVVVSIPSFSDLEIPLVPIVWVAIVGSVVVQELAQEYYRRQI